MTHRVYGMSFTLPYPPTVNHMYVRGRRGVFLTDKAKEFAKDVAKEVDLTVQGMAEFWGEEIIPPATPWKVSIFFGLPDKRRRDIDGPVKILLDSVTRTLGVDDVNIAELHVTRRLARKHPRAEIKISHVDEVADEQG